MVVSLLVAGLVGLNAQQVVAAETGSADALITKGLELRQSGQDRQALPLFQEAARKEPTPRATAQVGLCEYALGLWVEAEDHVQKALAGRTDPWIRKNERSLKAALDGIQERLGLLDVWGEPAAARVAVDGHPVGGLPLEHPLRLTAGRHSLVIEAAGYLAETRFVDVPARTQTREHVALAPIPVLTPQPPATTPVTVVSNGSAKGAGAADGDAASSSADPIYTRWWFWTAIGVVAVAAGGTVFVLSRNKDHCQSSGGGSCVTF